MAPLFTYSVEEPQILQALRGRSDLHRTYFLMKTRLSEIGATTVTKIALIQTLFG